LQTMLAKITDYWDSVGMVIDERATELGKLPLGDVRRQTALAELSASVTEHVRVLSDKLFATLASVVVDDLYKTACWIDRWDRVLADYLQATATVFWSKFTERGFTVHYLVDNVFDDLQRPTELFSDWFRAAGIIYACPQAVALELARETEGERESIEQDLLRHMAEARELVESVLDRCRVESRHYFLLDLDFDERTFKSSMAQTDERGLLTVFRNEAARPGTKILIFLPIDVR
jgi:hypothetical protein